MAEKSRKKPALKGQWTYYPAGSTIEAGHRTLLDVEAGEALKQTPDRLREAIGAHYAQVRTGFAFLVRDRETVDDLTQEVFVGILESVSAGREIRDLPAFIKGTMRNVFRGYLRKKKAAVIPVAMDDDPPDGGKPDALECAEQRDTKQQLRDLLASLYPEDQWLIASRHFFGMSGREIAESVGKPRRTVVDAYNRAMNRLRKLAVEHGIGL